MTTPEPEHTLVLLRHGKSDWSGGQPDIDRPLAKRGERQAPEAGRWLQSSGLRLARVVVSPAERARRTWDLVAGELTAAPTTVLEERVYAASAEELLEVVQGLPEEDRTVVLVGHNPGSEDLAELLTEEPVRMTTSALAVIDLETTWAEAGPGAGVLRAAGRPPS